jgi:hypothetical protein
MFAAAFVSFTSIWSVILPSNEKRQEDFDEIQQSKFWDTPAMLFKISQWVWYGFYFFFFFSTAWVLRPLMLAIKTEANIVVWGLSSSWASDGIILTQLLAFGFLVFFILNETEKTKDVNSRTLDYIQLAYDYDMLVTFFFLHNIVFSLSHIEFDHSADNDEEAGGRKEESLKDIGDTSESSNSHEEDDRLSIKGPGGATIILTEASPQVYAI